jgi:hypothetical protein
MLKRNNMIRKTGILLVLFASVLSACNTKCNQEANQLKKEIDMKNQIAERNKANTIAFFKALESENVNTVVDLFAEDAIHINPYASGLFPDEPKVMRKSEHIGLRFSQISMEWNFRLKSFMRWKIQTSLL